MEEQLVAASIVNNLHLQDADDAGESGRLSKVQVTIGELASHLQSFGIHIFSFCIWLEKGNIILFYRVRTQ